MATAAKRADSLWYIQLITEVHLKDTVHFEEYFAVLHDDQLLRHISSISQGLIRRGSIVTDRTTTVVCAWIGARENELNIQIIQARFNLTDV